MTTTIILPVLTDFAPVPASVIAPTATPQQAVPGAEASHPEASYPEVSPSLAARVADANVDTQPLSTRLSESQAYLRKRYLIDQAVAGVLLILTAPVLLVLMAIIRITSPGKAVYTQQRVGLNGRLFTIYKLRSMTIDAEAGRGAVWSTPGDPRVTSIGRFLRWSHLDELPQLVNILRGDMALIGPRPERPEFVSQLAEQVPSYRQRLNVLPGVTGLAQVTLPPDSDLSSVRRKTILDCEYIETASGRLDLHILFCTVMLAFGLQRKMDVRTWQAFA